MTIFLGGNINKFIYRAEKINSYSLFENNFGSTLGEDSESTVGQTYHSAHGFPDGVEGVYFMELLFGHFVPNCLIVFAQVEDKAQQSTLCLVADLFRQIAGIVGRLQKE